MKLAYLIRDEVSSECIRGTLVAESDVFHILERPWKNNQTNNSCILSGTYTARYLAR